MKDELTRVPQFTLTDIRNGEPVECLGTFDSPIRIGDGWIGYLVHSSGRLAKGTFYGFEARSRKAIFRPKEMWQIPVLQAGSTYAYLDGYWGERVALVLDSSRVWKRQPFKPQDSLDYHSGGVRIRGKEGQEPTFPIEGEPKKIIGGWDHEHCSICWETIAKYAQPVGYTDENGSWVCERCYASFVQPKQLGFLDDVAVSEIRGEKASHL